MKKTKQHNINYKSISAGEQAILQLVREKNLIIFGIQEIQRLSGWNPVKIHNTLHTLKEKGHVIQLKRNKYATPEKQAENPYAVATETVKPSYISYWTALSYYGFTEQQVKTIQLVSPKQQKQLLPTIEVVTLKPNRFYGYQRINDFVIAEKEKTLVDALHMPEKCGGLDEVLKCLKNAWSQINKKLFFSYLILFNDKSLNSRTGYIIETLGLGETPRKIIENKSKSYVKLDTRKPKIGGYDKRWMIIINHDIMGVQK